MPIDVQRRPEDEATQNAADSPVDAESHGPRTQFSADGALPGVAGGGPQAVQMSASEQAFGPETGVVQRKPALPEGDEGFQQMWEAHPHNYQKDGGENTSSEEVRDEHGLPAAYDNTCAIRLSIMLNGIGSTITPAKTASAGIKRKPHYSRKTKEYYILSAKEMWQYLTKHFRPPDVVIPPRGRRYKSEEEFNEDYATVLKPAYDGKHGIVAFDKLISWDGGTGHVDLFNGEALSDAPSWYAAESIRLWYI